MGFEGDGVFLMLNVLMTYEMHRGLEERWFDITDFGS